MAPIRGYWLLPAEFRWAAAALVFAVASLSLAAGRANAQIAKSFPGESLKDPVARVRAELTHLRLSEKTAETISRQKMDEIGYWESILYTTDFNGNKVIDPTVARFLSSARGDLLREQYKLRDIRWRIPQVERQLREAEARRSLSLKTQRTDRK